MAGQWADYRALLESLTRTLEDLTAVEQQKTAVSAAGTWRPWTRA